MAEKETTRKKPEEFSFTDWLVEGIEGITAKGKSAAFLPQEFRSHVKAANREALLALRSLLDKAIEWFEEEEKTEKKVTKIKVE